MSPPNLSGQIKLVGDALVYTLREEEAWRMPVADLRVVGEYTTEDPGLDDYFVVFIAREKCFQASIYVEGWDTLLAALGDRLHHKLRFELFGSANLASRVLWPARLEGRPLFDIVPEERADGFFGRLRQRILPRVNMNITEEVRREFESS